MSGTAYGTCVLHISPESYVGGPLALVRDGDPIRLDIPHRRLDLLIAEDELTARRAAWQRPVPREERGYLALYRDRVTQAHEGCDFDFLARGAGAGEPEIH
jgi:dihydroxy-acid dehydratase